MRLHVGTLSLSFAIALVLWLMAHGTRSIERGVDIPVVFDGVSETLVITNQSTSTVNIRVLGSRAALRDVSSDKLEYRIDVSGAKHGTLVHEVDASRIELPRGATVTSRSPAVIEAFFERRGRKAVQVQPEIEKEPAEGFRITAIEVEPSRVWLTGARRDVLRLTEVVTETIDVGGLDATLEREARLSLGSDHIWMEEPGPVTVRIVVEPVVEPVVE